MLAISFKVDDSEVQMFANQFEGEMREGILAGVEEEARVLNASIRDFTPHYNGVLEAVIGEFDDSLLEPGADANPADAVFWVGMIGKEYGAIVGTNLRYAPAVNDGYTVGPNQYAKFYEDGIRTLRRLPAGAWMEGAFMFEKGADQARPEYERIMQGVVSNAILNSTQTVRVSNGRVFAFTKRGTRKKLSRKPTRGY